MLDDETGLSFHPHDFKRGHRVLTPSYEYLVAGAIPADLVRSSLQYAAEQRNFTGGSTWLFPRLLVFEFASKWRTSKA